VIDIVLLSPVRARGGVALLMDDGAVAPVVDVLVSIGGTGSRASAPPITRPNGLGSPGLWLIPCLVEILTTS